MQTIIPSHGTEGIAQIALRVPVSMRDELKIEARRLGRSLNTHLVMTLRAAAGGKLGGEAPAARSNNAALAGGVSISQGIGGAEDDCL
ncbi:Arc family DNA-binding protein [Paracoccus yeei]|uniref:Arc family DNA-binding protein n=1 Tax=Paracoccus yeei TaxID=147645 RepID=UPI0012FD2983|nr:Arc family DNA-binding protein [Paracoccus yeei]